MCSYWNETSLKWSNWGCTLISQSDKHAVCSCNHLTNFALLMVNMIVFDIGRHAYRHTKYTLFFSNAYFRKKLHRITYTIRNSLIYSEIDITCKISVTKATSDHHLIIENRKPGIISTPKTTCIFLKKEVSRDNKKNAYS